LRALIVRRPSNVSLASSSSARLPVIVTNESVPPSNALVKLAMTPTRSGVAPAGVE